MWQSVQETYVESRILAASPMELVTMLYEASISAVRSARRHLASGEIFERSRSISKACGILIELDRTLDHERGGEISGRLSQLYDYAQRRLLEANIQQSDPPLAEVLGLLSTLTEGWHALRDRETETRAASPVSPWASSPEQEPELAARDWSL